MKHLILAAALLGATVTTSLAQGHWPPPPTAQQAQALKSDIIAKIADFQSDVTNNRKTKAEASANALATSMKKHVYNSRCIAEAATGAQKPAAVAHFNQIEGYVLAFMRKQQDPIANSADMLQAANDLVANY